MEEQLPSPEIGQRKPYDIYLKLLITRQIELIEKYKLTKYEGSNINEKELNDTIENKKKEFSSLSKESKEKKIKWLKDNTSLLPFLWEPGENNNLISLISNRTDQGLMLEVWAQTYLDYAELPNKKIFINNAQAPTVRINLSHGNLEKTQLYIYASNCDFIATNLTGCFFINYSYCSHNFQNATLNNAIFNGGIFCGSIFRDANFTDAKLYNVNFIKTDITFKQLKQTKHLWKVILPPNLLTKKEIIQLESKWIDSYAAEKAHTKKNRHFWFEPDADIPEEKLKKSTAIFQLIALYLPPSQWETDDKKVEQLYIKMNNAVEAIDLNTQLEHKINQIIINYNQDWGFFSPLRFKFFATSSQREKHLQELKDTPKDSSLIMIDTLTRIHREIRQENNFFGSRLLTEIEKAVDEMITSQKQHNVANNL